MPARHHLTASLPHCESCNFAALRAVLEMTRQSRSDTMRAPARRPACHPTATPFRLDGKLALVTGAGRGIGRAVALALGQAGAELLLNSRTPSELAAVAAEIAAQGGRGRCRST